VRTERIVRHHADGSYEELWCQEDQVELRQAFNGTLLFTQAFFAYGRLYALATCTIVGKKHRKTCSKVFLEGILDGSAVRASGVAPRLQFQRWCQQSDLIPARDFYFELVGMDTEGAGIWLRVRHSIVDASVDNVVVLPFDTLKARCCLSFGTTGLQLPGRCKKVCLDPLTRDLYLLQDRATEINDFADGPSVYVYRVRPAASIDSPGLDHLAYNGSSAALICCSEFGVDGYTDSFSVTSCSWYVEASDTLVVLDADDGVWSLPLRDARLQDPIDIEEPTLFWL